MNEEFQYQELFVGAYMNMQSDVQFVQNMEICGSFRDFSGKLSNPMF